MLAKSRGVLAAAFVLLALAALPARSQSRQNLLEYVAAALRKDNALSAQEQARMVAAIHDRFADYADKVVPKNDTTAADVVMRMIIEGTFDETAPERIADVSFAAFQAISRGAPADVVEGIALYGYRKKIPGERIAVWANGYKNLTDAKVPPDVAADLVRNAMERDWDDHTFMLLKQNLYQAAKERLNMRDYAVYLIGNMITGKKLPGTLGAEALTYFRKIAKTNTPPELPAYEGAFSRKPVEKMAYQAMPKQTAPAPEPVKPVAAPPAAPSPTPTPQPETKPQSKPAPPVEPLKPSKAAKAEPAPKHEATLEELGIAMSSLWPGLHTSAASYLGTPYVWGGATHKGIDCSGFTQNSYGENKVGIPRVSRDQWKTGDKIEWNDLREGDLVFFNTMGVGVSHVGMVVNANGPRFMHASSSRGVVQDELSKKYYKVRYLGARRIVP